MTPSYQSGFYAPGRGGTPKYPSLWRGCVGAWAPSLGQSGLVLRDHSGYRNHGTLTNMDAATDWVTSQGKRLLDFDGSNDHLPTSKAINAKLLGEMSISAYCTFRSPSTQGCIIGNVNTGGTSGFVFEIGRTANKLGWLQSGASVDAVSTGTITDSNLHHVMVVRTGSTGAWTITFWIDGVSSSHSTVVNPVPASSNGNLGIARFGDYTGGYCNMQLAEMMIFSRALLPNESRLLATRPGIAYEPSPRKVYSLPAAASIYKPYLQNYRSQIIGGGLK